MATPSDPLTDAQRQRLRQLGAEASAERVLFAGPEERDAGFKAMERKLTLEERRRLRSIPDLHRRPALCEIEAVMTRTLVANGFVQVATPTMISRSSLEKMGISAGHPLARQVFWLDTERCLRPMLAPNLYSLLRRLVRVWKKPIRIFETGSCFRKDSQGTHHLEEFTMLNLVELGVPLEGRLDRLNELVSLLMGALDMTDYRWTTECSEVYGETLDVTSANGMELCSAAMGPHPLDDAWGVVDPWVGVGFGLERLAMVKENYAGIQRAGRSLIYIGGTRLNV